MANEKKKPEHDEESAEAPPKHSKAEAKASAKPESKPKDEHEHGEQGHRAAHAAHGQGHTHKPNIREYMVIFVALAVLTFIEVAVTRPELHVPHGPMTLALIGLALTKAAIVALYYMHLKHETRVLKLTVALPMAAPTIYALVLISEAAWRLTR
jgi:cytochrome c oxidase subunit 4